MKITYDKEADVLHIKFSDNKIADSEEKERNVVVDYDKDDNIVAIEVLYFVKKYKKELFPVFKEIEKTVWETEMLIP